MVQIVILPAADAERVELTFPYDRAVLNAVKVLPGRQWHRERRRWSIPRRAVPRLSEALAGTEVRIIDRLSSRVFRRPPRYVRDDHGTVSAPARPRARVVLGDADLVRLLSVLHTMKHRAIALLLHSTGVRVSEVVRLRVEDVDTDRRVVRVRAAGGGPARYRRLSPLTAAELVRYCRLYRPGAYLFAGTNANRPLSAWAVRKLMRAAMHRAGIAPQRVTT